MSVTKPITEYSGSHGNTFSTAKWQIQRKHDQKLAGQDGDLVAWVSKGEGGREYLALFNVGDASVRVAVPLRRYGFAAEKYAARNVWEGKNLGKVSEAAAEVAAHGVLLLELKR